MSLSLDLYNTTVATNEINKVDYIKKWEAILMPIAQKGFYRYQHTSYMEFEEIRALEDAGLKVENRSNQSQDEDYYEISWVHVRDRINQAYWNK